MHKHPQLNTARHIHVSIHLPLHACSTVLNGMSHTSCSFGGKPLRIPCRSMARSGHSVLHLTPAVHTDLPTRAQLRGRQAAPVGAERQRAARPRSRAAQRAQQAQVGQAVHMHRMRTLHQPHGMPMTRLHQLVAKTGP